MQDVDEPYDTRPLEPSPEVLPSERTTKRPLAFLYTESMNKNKRQAYGVFNKAGHQHSAESWGTGRAVARIPRIAGSGTARAGQGAFGNMCRGGRMFAPTKTFRKWHVKVRRVTVPSSIDVVAELVSIRDCRSTRTSVVTPSLRLWLLLPFPLWSSPVVTESSRSRRFLSSSLTLPSL
jgi:hypothetical protein